MKKREMILSASSSLQYYEIAGVIKKEINAALVDLLERGGNNMISMLHEMIGYEGYLFESQLLSSCLYVGRALARPGLAGLADFLRWASDINLTD